jgi:(p)ppGpp synthase/HD superfamily hydrolase
MKKKNNALNFLKPVENKESFFKRISQIYSRYDDRYIMIEDAYNDAKSAFDGLERESGERYFEHLRAVALIQIDHLRIRDHRLIVAGLLHDIVEDIPSWPIQRVYSKYGKDIATWVDYSSKPSEKDISDKNERNRVFYKKLKDSPREVSLIKLPDRWHNTITLWDCPKEKILRKIAETKEHLLPLSEKHIVLIHELESTIAVLEKRLKKEEKVKLPVKPIKKKGGK